MVLFWWLVCVFRNVCWEHAPQVFSVGSGGKASRMGKSLKSSLRKTCDASSFFIPRLSFLLCGRMVPLCPWWKVRAHMVSFQILNYPSFVRATWERMFLLLFLLSKIAQIFQKQSHVSPLDYEPRARKQRKSEMYSSFICISERCLPSLE